MFIKQFREQQVRVQDPLRPGRRIFETRLNPTNCHTVNHEGEEYEADGDGWLEVPFEAGEALRSFRGPRGEKFYTPEEVDEEVVAGRIKPDPADKPPEPFKPPTRVPAPRRPCGSSPPSRPLTPRLRRLCASSPRTREWWDVSGSIFAYGELLALLWREAESFLIVEHDIELTPEALRQARTCRCEWSVSPYRGPSAYGWENAAVLNAVSGLHPVSVLAHASDPRRCDPSQRHQRCRDRLSPWDWHRLDCRLYSVLRGEGEQIRTPHVHAEVAHHHRFGYGCACGEDH